MMDIWCQSGGKRKSIKEYVVKKNELKTDNYSEDIPFFDHVQLYCPLPLYPKQLDREQKRKEIETMSR